MRDLTNELVLRLKAASLPARTAFARETPALPLVTAALKGGRTLLSDENGEYADEQTYALEFLAADTPTLDAMENAADAALTALGFKRMARVRGADDEADAFRSAAEYRAVVVGDTIYGTAD